VVFPWPCPNHLEVLSLRDRTILWLYYGLPVEGLQVDRPWTKAEIVAHLGEGLTVWQVTQALKLGVQRLFRPEEVRSKEARWADRSARISEKARVRGRPETELLRTLPVEAFARLPEPQRCAVRRYFGLEDGRPWTRREVAAACGRSAEWVARAVTKGTAQVLGAGTPRSVERQCIICEVVFSPESYRSSRQTCGDKCQSELRSRQAILSRAQRGGQTTRS